MLSSIPFSSSAVYYFYGSRFDYGPSKDGQRFLVNTETATGAQFIDVVIGWQKSTASRLRDQPKTDYSSRNVRAGSIRAIRKLGTTLASTATAKSTEITVTHVAGSVS